MLYIYVNINFEIAIEIRGEREREEGIEFFFHEFIDTLFFWVSITLLS